MATGRRISYNGLTELTGMTYRTVKKRLAAAGVDSVGKEGNALLFDSADALPALFVVSEQDSTLEAERLRLTKEQADAQELKNAVARGELLDGDEVEQEWQSMIAASRAKMLTIPTKVAADYPLVEERPRVEAMVKGYLYEALDELAAD